MKIIDAHLHLFSPTDDWAERLAQQAGHHNSPQHLRDVYPSVQIVHGVVMGNRNLDEEREMFAEDLFHYCVGFDGSQIEDAPDGIQTQLDRIRMHLAQKQCCGIKLYPGYNKIALSDRIYEPIYELAAQYDKPVAVHMGLTSQARAHLKYCHPLALDEVAADHPDTRFVMCHFGNPFLEAAAAVVEKNPNVTADLSGLLEGRVDLEQYFEEQAGYVFLLKTWLQAINCWDKLMFGTDWPIVNLQEYAAFIRRLVPERHWQAVFFDNANRIYGLGL